MSTLAALLTSALTAPVTAVLAGPATGVTAADPSPSPSAPPIDPERVTPGLLGLVSFLFLVVAVVLLYRSMRTQLGKVRPDLPSRRADQGRPEGPAEPPA